MSKMGLALLCGAASFAMSTTFAADDPMTAYYDSAVHIAVPDSHFESILWFNPDKTVQIFSSQATLPEKSFSVAGHDGKYRLNGNQLCINAASRTDIMGSIEGGKKAEDGSTQPAGLSNKEVCSDFTAHKLGDTWTEMLADGPFKGQMASFSIVERRKAPANGAQAPAAQADAPKPLDTKSADVSALMNDYYGNTRICREDISFECHMWLNADGTYILFSFDQTPVAGPRSGLTAVKGKWFVTGSKDDYKLCRQADGSPRAGCEPEAGLKLGDTFTKYHADGGLKGTYEHYVIAHGHI